MKSFKFVPLVGLVISLFAASPVLAKEIPAVVTPSSTVTVPAPKKKVEFFNVDNKQLYFGMSAGALQTRNRKLSGALATSSPGVKSDIGLTIGAEAGVRANEYVGAEINVDFAQFNDVFYPAGFGNSAIASLRHRQLLTFANLVIYPLGDNGTFKGETGPSFKINPTLLAGVGLVHDSLSAPLGGSKAQKNSFASNVGVGLQAEYGQIVDFGVKYRYLIQNNPITIDNGSLSGYKISKGDAHALTADIAVYF